MVSAVSERQRGSGERSKSSEGAAGNPLPADTRGRCSTAWAAEIILEKDLSYTISIWKPKGILEAS